MHAPGALLPERILQFGTGRFLRAFADSFVDEANADDRYAGRIVAVQSTGAARADALCNQSGLFTLWVRGGTSEAPHESHRIVSSVSRAIPAAEGWDRVLELARSKDLEAVFSNTTEVGLTLSDKDRLDAHPPASFPAKLTAFLLARAKHFDFHPDRGLVVLPCELVDANGTLLRSLVLATARRWKLNQPFEEWVSTANTFFNTLVDRIVPGLPREAEVRSFESRVGYTDSLLTPTEPYRIWAIEGNPNLGFVRDAEPIVVAQDIAPYRLRKVRLLNGGHTLSVPLGYLTGNRSVLENMRHPVTGPYIEALLRNELGPTLDVDPATVPPYIDEVLARWQNPFLRHELIDITLQGTTKMLHRVVPSLITHVRKRKTVPHLIAVGLASHLLFMRCQPWQTGYHGLWNDQAYAIQDDCSNVFAEAWRTSTPREVVQTVCANCSLWGTDLTILPEFGSAVTFYLETMLSKGVCTALEIALKNQGT